MTDDAVDKAHEQEARLRSMQVPLRGEWNADAYADAAQWALDELERLRALLREAISELDPPGYYGPGSLWARMIEAGRHD